MLAIERRNAILEKLRIEKRVVVSELSQIYDVSEETIRRDLEKLENDGFATKSYGGAVLNENTNLEFPFNVRKKWNVAEKQKIAEIISGMVGDGEQIILDASSTAVAIVKQLKEKKNLTLITNSVEIIIETADMLSEWKILSTGGILKESGLALVGPQTEKMLRSYHVDKVIISAKAVWKDAGFFDSDEFHAASKRTMLRSAKEKILAVDSSKFGNTAFAKIGSFSDINTVVTDREPPQEWLGFFREQGIRCLYPESAP